MTNRIKRLQLLVQFYQLQEVQYQDKIKGLEEEIDKLNNLLQSQKEPLSVNISQDYTLDDQFLTDVRIWFLENYRIHYLSDAGKKLLFGIRSWNHRYSSKQIDTIKSMVEQVQK